eukprot:TRINITY_DN12581_c0_g1_i2.p4 TRINITY_DN12581_c0_g1~~TRINITY_DN12581_c0_g1_i2.p4  ORF type:complete len:135 (-),score=6.78 TRINITY_DN12581_c0_g1_i2:32-436(-)
MVRISLLSEALVFFLVFIFAVETHSVFLLFDLVLFFENCLCFCYLVALIFLLCILKIRCAQFSDNVAFRQLNLYRSFKDFLGLLLFFETQIDKDRYFVVRCTKKYKSALFFVFCFCLILLQIYCKGNTSYSCKI